ncbi:MAG: phosphate ABC transporter substrate-binding protein [Clostridia bacterium]|nr:phosphate ABC transporter substrate-binding protein [Clostridia bacterium]
MKKTGKKKVIGVITAAMLSAVLFAGCAGGDAQPAETNNSAQQTQATVSTDGSTSMEKVIGYLSEAYMEENKNTKVTYNPTGSGAGIQAVSEGRCDIGLSSRDLKDDEAKTLDATVVAIDGIAVIVNPANAAEDLSVEQIAKIYTGEISNWKDAGGSDGAVVVIGREAASGTRDGFESITKTKDKCKYNQELTSTGDVIQTVASNPNAIGYASLAAVKDSVKVLKVDGVAPSKETVQDGTYKIQRDFVMVTKKGEKLSDDAQKFFDFATGKSADALIEKAGAIPVVR